MNKGINMVQISTLQQENLGFTYDPAFFKKIKLKRAGDNQKVVSAYLNSSFEEKDLKFILDTKAFSLDEFTLNKIKQSVISHSSDLFSSDDLKTMDQNLQNLTDKILPYLASIKDPTEKGLMSFFVLKKFPLLPYTEKKSNRNFNHHVAELVMNGVLLTNDLSPIDLNSEEDQEKIDRKLKELKEAEQQRLRRERERQEQQENEETVALFTFMIQSKMLIDATAELAEDLIQTQKNILTL